jgi:hypothetical protein
MYLRALEAAEVDRFAELHVNPLKEGASPASDIHLADCRVGDRAQGGTGFVRPRCAVLAYEAPVLEHGQKPMRSGGSHAKVFTGVSEAYARLFREK